MDDKGVQYGMERGGGSWRLEECSDSTGIQEGQQAILHELQGNLQLNAYVGKVFARVLNERVKVLTGDKVMDEQGGFRSGRGCIDQILQSSKLWRRPSRRTRRCT